MRVVPSALRKSRCRKSTPSSTMPTMTPRPVPAVHAPGVPARSWSARVAGTLTSSRARSGRAASIDTMPGSAATAASLLSGMSTVAMSPITERTTAPCALTAARSPSNRTIVCTSGSAWPTSTRFSSARPASESPPPAAAADSAASSLADGCGVAPAAGRATDSASAAAAAANSRTNARATIIKALPVVVGRTSRAPRGHVRLARRCGSVSQRFSFRKARRRAAPPERRKARGDAGLSRRVRRRPPETGQPGRVARVVTARTR